MAENNTLQDILVNKKTDGYYVNMDNFVISNELTVSITLNEYRDLITTKAKYDAKESEYQNKFCEAHQRAEKLAKESKKQGETIVRYITKFGVLPDEETEEAGNDNNK